MNDNMVELDRFTVHVDLQIVVLQCKVQVPVGTFMYRLIDEVIRKGGMILPRIPFGRTMGGPYL